MLVDGLWAAGAEAISINGQRLTALARSATWARRSTSTAGRCAAVHRLAIGDTTLQARLLDTSLG